MEDLGYLGTLPNLCQGAIGMGYVVKNLIDVFEIHCNKTNKIEHLGTLRMIRTGDVSLYGN